MKVNVGGSLKTVTAIKFNPGTGLKNVSRIKANIAGSLKAAGSFILPLSLSVNSDAPFGRTFGSNPVTTFIATTVTPTGGLAPFTYSWARLSGTGTPTSPVSANTYFVETVADYDTETGVFRCTVTDVLGSTAFTDITATFNNLGPA